VLLEAPSAFIHKLESIRGNHVLRSGLLDAHSCQESNGKRFAVLAFHKLRAYSLLRYRDAVLVGQAMSERPGWVPKACFAHQSHEIRTEERSCKEPASRSQNGRGRLSGGRNAFRRGHADCLSNCATESTIVSTTTSSPIAELTIR
jgi:hypothetical protein